MIHIIRRISLDKLVRKIVERKPQHRGKPHAMENFIPENSRELSSAPNVSIYISRTSLRRTAAVTVIYEFIGNLESGSFHPLRSIELSRRSINNNNFYMATVMIVRLIWCGISPVGKSSEQLAVGIIACIGNHHEGSSMNGSRDKNKC